MGPTFNFKKNYQNKSSSRTEGQTEVSEILFYFYLLNLLSSIPEFLTIGFRRVKHEKCSTRRELRVGTKNTGFRQDFK